MNDLIDRQQAIDVIDKEQKEIDVSDVSAMYAYSKCKTIIKQLPSALGTNLAEVGTDLISRQAAIDIERNATVDTNPSHFEAHQKFTQFMDDAEISSFGRWQWSNGFNTALTAVGIDLKKLPSAQPDLSEYSDKLWQKAYERGKAEAQAEIVRCKDCRFNTYSKKCLNPDSFFLVPADDFYCGYAERRTDEQTKD